MSTDEQQESRLQGFFAGRTPIIILIVLIILSLAAICTFGYFLLRPQNDDTAVTDVEPTPFPDNSSSTAVTADDEAIVMGISETTVISVTLDAPVTLLIGGQDFNVQQQTINPDGTWSPGLSNNETSGWIYGSIVNYIMALSDSPENRELLDSLAPGAQFLLETVSGARYLFEYESQETVPVNDQTIFSQHSPGMTLVLLGAGGDERLVINGRYLVNESSGNNDSGDTAVGVGEPAQLSDLQIMVTGVTYLPDSPQAPAGFAFFLVDFQIQNVGTTAFDASNLQLILVDEIGNQYALNPVAGTQGANQPLTGGFINPGESIQATVGYQIPEGLISPSLQWTVTDTTTGGRVQVTIPYNGGNAAQSAIISLQRVEVTNDLLSLVLVGQIINQGDQPLVVTTSDVTLESADGTSYLLLAANPPFPWTIPPGQTLLYAVTFQRPNSETAVFTILNQPFQLSNIR